MKTTWNERQELMFKLSDGELSETLRNNYGINDITGEFSDILKDFDNLVEYTKRARAYISCLESEEVIMNAPIHMPTLMSKGEYEKVNSYLGVDL